MNRAPTAGRLGVKLTRRKFLGGLACLGLGAPAYARFFEPTWLDVSRYELKLGAGNSRPPLKLLHLSDLHASEEVSLEFIERAIARGLALKPDLICLTGDFVTRRFDQLVRYAEILAQLPAQAPTLACLGNHDGGDWSARNGGYTGVREVLDLLARSRITTLHDAAQPLDVCGWKLQLVGLSDYWAGDFSPERAFPTTQSGAAATIVLSHNPDTKDPLRGYRWDLMLSGHTHGGQFRFPVVGTPFAPVRDKRFVQGLHTWEGRRLHITKGIGNVLGLRFNCRPEISLLTLT